MTKNKLPKQTLYFLVCLEVLQVFYSLEEILQIKPPRNHQCNNLREHILLWINISSHLQKDGSTYKKKCLYTLDIYLIVYLVHHMLVIWATIYKEIWDCAVKPGPPKTWSLIKLIFHFISPNECSLSKSIVFWTRI